MTREMRSPEARRGLASLSLDAAHRLWLRLPRRLRQQLFYHLTALSAPKPARHAAGGFPVGIAGLFGTASGLGEGARLMLDSFEAAGFAPEAFDLSAAFHQADLAEPPRLRPLTPSEGTLITHINGPYLPYALRILGADRVRRRRIIGYWAWELPALPESWQIGLRFVHELWVPSEFTRSAVAAATTLPVRVVPHPMPPIEPPRLGRADFGFALETIVVLCIFNIGSSFERKNPLATVEAFRRAFGDAPDRLLVLKLVDPGTAPWARQRLDAAIAGARNIRVMDQRMPHREIMDLIAASDIVISLHRAEGFGLVPAEAMHRGKPVVATGWSGNLDFMTERNAALVPYRLVPASDPQGTYDMAEQSWAEPDVEAAALWLRRLAEDDRLRAELGAAAARDVGARLAPDTLARKARELLVADQRSV